MSRRDVQPGPAVLNALPAFHKQHGISQMELVRRLRSGPSGPLRLRVSPVMYCVSLPEALVEAPEDQDQIC